MSMQQGLGIIGGIVGAFFGYPQLGFVVGSLVGGLLTPGEKTEGPRLDDTKVSVSTYGVGKGINYGNNVWGGNWLWSTDKIEVATTTEAGKGGGAENTTYRYFIHGFLALCESPPSGISVAIRKMWVDGKLQWDRSSGIPVGSALASEDNPYTGLAVMTGAEDQPPIAPMEAWMGGPGSVPAYRGVCGLYIVSLETPNGRVPQISVELCFGAADEVAEDLLFTAPGGVNSYGASVTSEGAWHVVGVPGVHPKLDVYYGTAGESAFQRRIELPYVAPGNYYNVRSIQGQAAGLFFVDNSEDTTIYRVDYEVGICIPLAVVEGVVGLYGGNLGGTAQDPVTERYAWFRRGTGGTDAPFLLNNGVITAVDAFTGDFNPLAFFDGIIYGLQSSAGALSLAHRDGETGDAIGVDIAGPTLGSVTIMRSALQVTADGIYALIASGGHSLFYLITPAGWTLLADADVNMEALDDPTSPTFWTNGKAAILPNSGAGNYYFVRFQSLAPVEAKVSDIIADLCERAGETRYDVSAIPDTDTVWGCKFSNPASARSNIDPLLTAFDIFVVDEDGMIKFKKYQDITSEATIAYDELGQAEDGSEAADAMPLSRTQEVDLPKSVTVSYLEPTFDYQTASEKEIRQVTEATEEQSYELPIATNSDHAKQIAQRIMFAQWRGQNQRSLKVSRKYAFLSPGDGITVEYPRGVFRLWRITSMTDTGALVELNVEPGDAELYTQTAIGATGYVGQTVAPLAPLTRVQVLNIPILRDVDNNAGVYAALSGLSSGYPGGELFVGDEDTSLQSRGTVENESPIGVAETALGAWSLGVIDETNLLTVNVGHHELSSITQDVMLSSNTQNVAAIGADGRWEIIKFQRASSLGSGRYILSGLLRGMRGTEHNRGNHADGDTFVVLALAGMLRPNLEAGSIGQSKRYRGVTQGRSFNSASSFSYVNTGEGLEPFSPTNLAKSISSGNITFSWVRRTRLSENWLNGIVPLGETSERYDVVLYTSSAFTTVRRTISATTNSATYTSAMQSEDGYTTGSLYVRVYQLSDVVGRGHALEATI